jgi:hypothetical protein
MDLQQEAIKQIRAGKSLFLTGSGGVGKSWVIDQIVDSNTILCAPSGIAALNIGGVTCHRAFGLPLGIPVEKDNYPSKKVKDLFYGNAVKRIVIDEVGMVRTDYLVLMSRKLQHIKNNTKPFGGIQMVFVGDFYQLEPILSNNEKEFFQFDSKFCFSSKLWDFPTIELIEPKRHNNKRQVLMLNSIRRKDKFYKKALEYIQKECKVYAPTEDTLHLCCYNRDADQINGRYYESVVGVERVFKASFSTAWGRDRPVDEVLKLKVGVRVLICKNSLDGDYVNGERGFVLGFGVTADKEFYVVVEKQDGDIVNVFEAEWEKYSYKKEKLIGADGETLVKNVDAKYSQIPLKYGWAVSIHKSQGMSLDDVAIDVGSGCFSHGQAYVALSRIRDLENLSFVNPMLPQDIIVREEVKRFMSTIGLDTGGSDR